MLVTSCFEWKVNLDATWELCTRTTIRKRRLSRKKNTNVNLHTCKYILHTNFVISTMIYFGLIINIIIVSLGVEGYSWRKFVHTPPFSKYFEITTLLSS